MTYEKAMTGTIRQCCLQRQARRLVDIANHILHGQLYTVDELVLRDTSSS